MAVYVKKHDNETTDELIARFKSRVKKAGIINEVKLREFYMNEHDRRLMKKKIRK